MRPIRAIGIPNRSSFLHPSAIAQCLRWGVLPPKSYHAAKLYYPGHRGLPEIVLARSSSLVKLMRQGHVDMIFTGEDYANEVLEPNEFFAHRIPFYEVCFALLSKSASISCVETLYTKFPKTALKFLSQWSIPFRTMKMVSGASETYCYLEEGGAAFDVICTGITKRANQLHAIHQGPPLTCAWYSNRETLPPALQNILDDQVFIQTVAEYYSGFLAQRDHDMANLVGRLANYELAHVG